MKKIGQKPESITDDWIEDYWQHKKVNNPYSYDKGEEIQFDYQGFVRFCKRYCKNPAGWSEEDEKMCQETIDWFEKKCFPYALESENPARESIKWLKSLKQRIGG